MAESRKIGVRVEFACVTIFEAFDAGPCGEIFSMAGLGILRGARGRDRGGSAVADEADDGAVVLR